MRDEISVSFICKKSRVSLDGTSPVEMRINAYGNVLEVATNLRHSPHTFRDRSNAARTNDLTRALADLTTSAKRRARFLLENGLPFTIDNMKHMGEGEYMQDEYLMSDLIKEYDKLLKRRVGVNLTPLAYRKYQLASDVMLELLGDKTPVRYVSYSQLELLYIELQSRYNESTSAGYMTKVKSIFTYAFNNGRIPRNPSSQIHIHKGETPVEYLTEEELERIRGLRLFGYLARVRDLCIFQAYGGGMAYCDLVEFDADKIEMNGDTALYKGKRKKTDVKFTTVLLPPALEILDKYDGKLPIISNQKFNYYLKDIAKKAKIKKNLHSHLMRKSYATMLINRNVPMSTVSECLGHTSSKITEKIYAHTTENTIVNQVSKAFGI